MSAEALSASIEKLLKLHKSLYELAVKKTDIIKTGDMEALDLMLKDEQTHIAAIEQTEKERQKTARTMVPQVEQPTVSDCLESFDAVEQDRLSKMVNELSLIVHSLKEKNYLNQQLIHQSLQFVHFSMGLLRPQPTNINYGPPSKNQKPSEHHSSSVFNSEA
ncbi:flagellar protein FlgN [Bacillus sp. JJ1773]|uniref:flagellar protein FlgN n=1 Tax=Bacillus sp. JJ1773 TaxID=3122965 RepID=UPI002FFE98BD